MRTDFCFVLIAATCGLAGVTSQSLSGAAQVREYPIQPVAIDAVDITDTFWRPRMETNRTVTIPHIIRQNELTGRVANFAKAAGREKGEYVGRRFNDTDIYKAIEAASYSLIKHPDADLDRRLDELIALIAGAQEKDGYLFPARTINPQKPAAGVGPERWVHLNGSHELYNSGHLYEAAVAHFLATGKRTLLDVAIRNADLVRRTFGPDGRRAAPGHEEIELALVRLYRTTGEVSYLDLAKFFLDRRGRPHDIEPYPDGPFAMYNGREYKQDHALVVEQQTAVGHAVRATYLYAGMADIAALLRDGAYSRALDSIWTDVVSKKMYLTGGVGSRAGVEAFGDDYELPNRRAYTETCASIGHELWNHRMFQLHGDARYLDMFEQILLNGYLSGVSLSGDRFFYQNPLESDGRRERSPYFDVACCPANLARVMAQLPGMVYAHTPDAIFVNLYVGSRASIPLESGTVRLTQETEYPWNGDSTIRVDPSRAAEFTVNVRIPGWTGTSPVPSDLYRFVDAPKGSPVVAVNGQPITSTPVKGFVSITRQWKAGDFVTVTLPMSPRRVAAHPEVTDNRGRVAVQRGPLVYAAEAIDNGGGVSRLLLPADAALTAAKRPDLLGGVTVVTAKGVIRSADGNRSEQDIVLIPYFAWANRRRGEMSVWLSTR